MSRAEEKLDWEQQVASNTTPGMVHLEAEQHYDHLRPSYRKLVVGDEPSACLRPVAEKSNDIITNFSVDSMNSAYRSGVIEQMDTSTSWLPESRSDTECVLPDTAMTEATDKGGDYASRATSEIKRLGNATDSMIQMDTESLQSNARVEPITINYRNTLSNTTRGLILPEKRALVRAEQNFGQIGIDTTNSKENFHQQPKKEASEESSESVTDLTATRVKSTFEESPVKKGVGTHAGSLFENDSRLLDANKEDASNESDYADANGSTGSPPKIKSLMERWSDINRSVSKIDAGPTSVLAMDEPISLTCRRAMESSSSSATSSKERLLLQGKQRDHSRSFCVNSGIEDTTPENRKSSMHLEITEEMRNDDIEVVPKLDTNAECTSRVKKTFTINGPLPERCFVGKSGLLNVDIKEVSDRSGDVGASGNPDGTQRVQHGIERWVEANTSATQMDVEPTSSNGTDLPVPLLCEDSVKHSSSGITTDGEQLLFKRRRISVTSEPTTFIMLDSENASNCLNTQAKGDRCSHYAEKIIGNTAVESYDDSEDVDCEKNKGDKYCNFNRTAHIACEASSSLIYTASEQTSKNAAPNEAFSQNSTTCWLDVGEGTNPKKVDHRWSANGDDFTILCPKKVQPEYCNAVVDKADPLPGIDSDPSRNVKLPVQPYKDSYEQTSVVQMDVYSTNDNEPVALPIQVLLAQSNMKHDNKNDTNALVEVMDTDSDLNNTVTLVEMKELIIESILNKSEDNANCQSNAKSISSEKELAKSPMLLCAIEDEEKYNKTTIQEHTNTEKQIRDINLGEQLQNQLSSHVKMQEEMSTPDPALYCETMKSDIRSLMMPDRKTNFETEVPLQNTIEPLENGSVSNLIKTVGDQYQAELANSSKLKTTLEENNSSRESLNQMKVQLLKKDAHNTESGSSPTVKQISSSTDESVICPMHKNAQDGAKTKSVPFFVLYAKSDHVTNSSDHLKLVSETSVHSCELITDVGAAPSGSDSTICDKAISTFEQASYPCHTETEIGRNTDTIAGSHSGRKYTDLTNCNSSDAQACTDSFKSTVVGNYTGYDVDAVGRNYKSLLKSEVDLVVKHDNSTDLVSHTENLDPVEVEVDCYYEEKEPFVKRSLRAETTESVCTAKRGLLNTSNSEFMASNVSAGLKCKESDCLTSMDILPPECNDFSERISTTETENTTSINSVPFVKMQTYDKTNYGLSVTESVNEKQNEHRETFNLQEMNALYTGDSASKVVNSEYIVKNCTDIQNSAENRLSGTQMDVEQYSETIESFLTSTVKKMRYSKVCVDEFASGTPIEVKQSDQPVEATSLELVQSCSEFNGAGSSDVQSISTELTNGKASSSILEVNEKACMTVDSCNNNASNLLHHIEKEAETKTSYSSHSEFIPNRNERNSTSIEDTHELNNTTLLKWYDHTKLVTHDHLEGTSTTVDRNINSISYASPILSHAKIVTESNLTCNDMQVISLTETNTELQHTDCKSSIIDTIMFGEGAKPIIEVTDENAESLYAVDMKVDKAESKVVDSSLNMKVQNFNNTNESINSPPVGEKAINTSMCSTNPESKIGNDSIESPVHADEEACKLLNSGGKSQNNDYNHLIPITLQKHDTNTDILSNGIKATACNENTQSPAVDDKSKKHIEPLCIKGMKVQKASFMTLVESQGLSESRSGNIHTAGNEDTSKYKKDGGDHPNIEKIIPEKLSSEGIFAHDSAKSFIQTASDLKSDNMENKLTIHVEKGKQNFVDSENFDNNEVSGREETILVVDIRSTEMGSKVSKLNVVKRLETEEDNENSDSACSTQVDAGVCGLSSVLCTYPLPHHNSVVEELHSHTEVMVQNASGMVAKYVNSNDCKSVPAKMSEANIDEIDATAEIPCEETLGKAVCTTVEYISCTNGNLEMDNTDELKSSFDEKAKRMVSTESTFCSKEQTQELQNSVPMHHAEMYDEYNNDDSHMQLEMEVEKCNEDCIKEMCHEQIEEELMDSRTDPEIIMSDNENNSAMWMNNTNLGEKESICSAIITNVCTIPDEAMSIEIEENTEETDCQIIRTIKTEPLEIDISENQEAAAPESPAGDDLQIMGSHYQLVPTQPNLSGYVMPPYSQIRSGDYYSMTYRNLTDKNGSHGGSVSADASRPTTHSLPSTAFRKPRSRSFGKTHPGYDRKPFGYTLVPHSYNTISVPKSKRLCSIIDYLKIVKKIDERSLNAPVSQKKNNEPFPVALIKANSDYSTGYMFVRSSGSDYNHKKALSSGSNEEWWTLCHVEEDGTFATVQAAPTSQLPPDFGKPSGLGLSTAKQPVPILPRTCQPQSAQVTSKDTQPTKKGQRSSSHKRKASAPTRNAKRVRHAAVIKQELSDVPPQENSSRANRSNALQVSDLGNMEFFNNLLLSKYSQTHDDSQGAQHSSEDSKGRRSKKKPTDPQHREIARQRNKLHQQKLRQDPYYRQMERERNRLYLQKLRSDPMYRQKERERNRIYREKLRQRRDRGPDKGVENKMQSNKDRATDSSFESESQ